MFQDENVSQAITQGGGCLTLHSKWKSAFDDSEASDNETEMKGENLASPEHAKQAGAGGDAEQVAATTRALELSRITENTSCKEEGAGKGESDKKQSLHIDIQLPLPGSNVAACLFRQQRRSRRVFHRELTACPWIGDRGEQLDL